jgi:hypothetical protein
LAGAAQPENGVPQFSLARKAKALAVQKQTKNPLGMWMRNEFAKNFIVWYFIFIHLFCRLQNGRNDCYRWIFNIELSLLHCTVQPLNLANYTVWNKRQRSHIKRGKKVNFNCISYFVSGGFPFFLYFYFTFPLAFFNFIYMMCFLFMFQHPAAKVPWKERQKGIQTHVYSGEKKGIKLKIFHVSDANKRKRETTEPNEEQKKKIN